MLAHAVTNDRPGGAVAKNVLPLPQPVHVVAVYCIRQPCGGEFREGQLFIDRGLGGSCENRLQIYLLRHRKSLRRHCIEKPAATMLFCRLDGGQYWDRTSDPRRVKAVLYR